MFFFLPFLFVMTDLKELRQHLRNNRRQIASVQCHSAQLAIIEWITALKVYQAARRIAGYWAKDGELDVTALLVRARADGKMTYLPVMTGIGQPLLFAPYTSTTLLQDNRYKIPEPVVPANQIIKPIQLDLVLTPLVGFDDEGLRLGMGGGFYDRSFAFRRRADALPQPCLIGIAYESQHLPQLLPKRDWDIPLDAVITESGVYRWHTELL